MSLPHLRRLPLLSAVMWMTLETGCLKNVMPSNFESSKFPAKRLHQMILGLLKLFMFRVLFIFRTLAGRTQDLLLIFLDRTWTPEITTAGGIWVELSRSDLFQDLVQISKGLSHGVPGIYQFHLLHVNGNKKSWLWCSHPARTLQPMTTEWLARTGSIPNDVDFLTAPWSSGVLLPFSVSPAISSTTQQSGPWRREKTQWNLG